MSYGECDGGNVRYGMGERLFWVGWRRGVKDRMEGRCEWDGGNG